MCALFPGHRQNKFMVAGGKGANLGELSRIGGIRVPDGFCVTTEAYKKITENDQELNSLLKTKRSPHCRHWAK